ncbi:MAG: type II toxin-antitoxin system RelE/ParE family toxin [Nevskiales bacterium]|nr:type II toxin-antitoxin system RelE/ParE family toxin [Nevskiales bacterium]
MTKPVVQRPRADRDIDDVFAHLRKGSPTAARKFLDSVVTAYRMLSEHPASGSTRHAPSCPELPYPLRFHPLNDFPRILIYYMDRPDAVEIIRIWDAARGLEALLPDP